MSNTNVITNKLSHKSCYMSGGKCSTTDTIYATECTRHSMIYVGQSSQKLNSRFNGHRSDVKVKPKACELSQHFHNNKECNIDRDLKVYILQLQFEKICKNFLRVVLITLTSIVIFPLSSQSPVCNIATYLTKSACYIYFIFDWSNTQFGHFSN